MLSGVMTRYTCEPRRILCDAIRVIRVTLRKKGFVTAWGLSSVFCLLSSYAAYEALPNCVGSVHFYRIRFPLVTFPIHSARLRAVEQIGPRGFLL